MQLESNSNIRDKFYCKLKLIGEQHHKLDLNQSDEDS